MYYQYGPNAGEDNNGYFLPNQSNNHNQAQVYEKQVSNAQEEPPHDTLNP